MPWPTDIHSNSEGARKKTFMSPGKQRWHQGVTPVTWRLLRLHQVVKITKLPGGHSRGSMVESSMTILNGSVRVLLFSLTVTNKQKIKVQ